MFTDTEHVTPKGHTTATLCRPDVVARCVFTQLHWAEFEATVEIESKGKKLKDRMGQGATYTSFLLQARPDLNSVLGLYVDKAGLVFMISDAEGVKQTDMVSWKDLDSAKLLQAFITRLYSPHDTMVDPTVERVQGNPGSFNVKLALQGGGETTCFGYPHCISHAAFGRRTTIFIEKDSPTKIDGKPIHVIKEQYREPNHRFDEPMIINHIHRDGPFPGVIQLVHYEDVKDSKGTEISSGTRNKVRLTEKDWGTPFMDIKTPREALLICYDLLESESAMCCFLYISDHLISYTLPIH